MLYERIIDREGKLNLYEEAHPKNVREALGILDRYFLDTVDYQAREAYELIRKNLKEVVSKSVLDDFWFYKYRDEPGYGDFVIKGLGHNISNFITDNYRHSVVTSMACTEPGYNEVKLSLYILDPYALMPKEVKGNGKSHIANNGRCTKCGKELDNNRLFLCEDCSKLQAQEANSNGSV